MASIWVVKDSEPLPVDGPPTRRYRAGLLTRALVRRGHEVRWFSSAFDHLQKRLQTGHVGELASAEGTILELSPSIPYRRNLSLARIRHNRLMARHMAARFRELPRPDMIVVDFPTPDCAARVADYAAETGVPYLICVRDLWPDFFRQVLGPGLRQLASPYIAYLEAQTRYAFRGAYGVVGISDAYFEFGLTKAGRASCARDIIVPLGYPDMEVDAAALSEAQAVLAGLGLDPARPIAVFAGTLGQTYDLMPAIRAWTGGHVPEDWQLLIMGGGDDVARYRGAAAGDARIVVPGFVESRLIPPILELSTLALASYGARAPQELPNKIFEYMSRGLPILSSLGGQAKEMLAEAGIGATYEDPSAFLGAFEALVGQGPEGLAAMGTRARSYFAEHFDESIVYPRYAAHIEQLVAERGPGA